MVNDIERGRSRSRNRRDLGQRILRIAAAAGSLLAPALMCARDVAEARSPARDIPLPVPRPHFPSDAPLTPRASPGTPQQAAPPQPAGPPVAPSGARLDVSPAPLREDAECSARLARLDLTAPTAEVGPQPDARCTVAQPVRLEELRLTKGTRVSFPEHPLLACATAEALALYVRDLLAPLVRGTYGSELSGIATGPGLECRARDHVTGGKLSAHGRGLAVDIAHLTLANGATLDVGAPKSPLDAGFQTAARAGGCGYFHTALGPGSDSFHATHWHFDLEARGKDGDTKFCR